MANGSGFLTSPSFNTHKFDVFEQVSEQANNRPRISYIKNNYHRKNEGADAWAANCTGPSALC